MQLSSGHQSLMGQAQQYYCRPAYDDILVSPVQINDTLSVTVVNDRRTPAKGRLTITAMTLDGKPVFTPANMTWQAYPRPKHSSRNTASTTS